MTRQMQYSGFSAFQRGVGLIEVLVTALVLGVGLIGMATLQAKAIKFNYGAYLRSQANVLAYDIADRMRVNRNATTNSNYVTAYSDPETGTETIAQKDLSAWKTLIANNLPNGQGAITCSAANDDVICTVSIRWSETTDASINASAPANEFVYASRF